MFDVISLQQIFNEKILTYEQKIFIYNRTRCDYSWRRKRAVRQTIGQSHRERRKEYGCPQSGTEDGTSCQQSH
jgi:hypothetical protein